MQHALNGSAINGWVTHFAGGATAMAIVATGDTELASLAGPGTAALTLTATGATLIGTLAGSGAALLDIEAWHGLPSPMPIPDGFMGAHKRAVMLVPPQPRALRVAAETIARVREAQRPARVPRERNL